MTTRTSAFAVMIGVVATAQWAEAGPTSYTCTLMSFQQPPGVLSNTDWVGKEAMKTQVGIDRATGRVIHKWIGNTSLSDIHVLNPGSKDWGFKVIASDGIGGSVSYYEVQEYAEGERKPFLAIAHGIAYFGWCE